MDGKCVHQGQYLACGLGVRQEDRAGEHVQIRGHYRIRYAWREDAGSHQIENLGRDANSFECC